MIHREKGPIKVVRYVFLLFIILFGLASIIGTSGDEIEEDDNVSNAQGANTLPTATINSPVDASVYTEGDLVTFTGTGTDTEDGTLSGGALVWSSSIDGMIGVGGSVRDIPMSTGTHTITLTVTDNNGGTASTTVSITLNPEGNTIPTAAISAPSNSSTFNEGSFITFSGTGSDTEDGNLTGSSLVWSSSIDGQIGTGNSFTVRDLSAGTHTVRLTASDSAGTTGTANISITIGNSSPTAAITSPTTGSTVNEGVSVTFVGTGTDTEDGALGGNSMTWRSNKDGFIGMGTSTTATYLSSGSHTITLQVIDSDGATGTASITLTVGNTVPVAAITYPATGATFSDTDLIVFTGTGTDDEDGNLYGSSLVWTSNIDGYIGTGTSFSTILTAGAHTINLTVTDSNGAAHSVTISITVT